MASGVTLRTSNALALTAGVPGACSKRLRLMNIVSNTSLLAAFQEFN
jgi:hypothetical protein